MEGSNKGVDFDLPQDKKSLRNLCIFMQSLSREQSMSEDCKDTIITEEVI